MDFNCKMCNYLSRDKFNYNKHLKTKKHIEKVQDVTIGTLEEHQRNHKGTPEINNDTSISKLYKCNYCSNNYATSGSLARHKKGCADKVVNDKKYYNELEICKNELNHLKEALSQRDDMILVLKSEVTYFKSLVNNSSSMIKDSMSTMAYAIETYKWAMQILLTIKSQLTWYVYDT